MIYGINCMDRPMIICLLEEDRDLLWNKILNEGGCKGFDKVEYKDYQNITELLNKKGGLK